MSLVPLLFSKAVCLGLVLWACLSLGAAVVEKRELTHTGLPASATITKHHKNTVPGSRSSRVDFLIDYAFTSRDKAEEHSTGVELPADLWKTVQAGSTISVTYNATNPSDNQPTMILKRLSPTTTNMIDVVVSALLVVISIWFSCSLFRMVTSRRRKSKALDSRTHVAAAGARKNHGSKRNNSKVRIAGFVLVNLAIIAVCLGVFTSVFAFGAMLVGPFVVDLMQNILL